MIRSAAVAWAVSVVNKYIICYGKKINFCWQMNVDGGKTKIHNLPPPKKVHSSKRSDLILFISHLGKKSTFNAFDADEGKS